MLSLKFHNIILDRKFGNMEDRISVGKFTSTRRRYVSQITPPRSRFGQVHHPPQARPAPRHPKALGVENYAMCPIFMLTVGIS